MSEKKLRDILFRATRDREFREAFLADPVTVGKKHGVVFSKKQLKTIKEAAAVVESVKDIIFPFPRPDPKYPLPPMINNLAIREISYILPDRALIDPIKYVFYPIPWFIKRERIGKWRDI